MVAELSGSAILAFLFLFWKHPGTSTKWSTGLWSGAFLLGGIGTFFLGMRGILPDSITLVLANFLILLGTGLRRSAIAAFFQRPKRFWVAVAVAGAWVLLCFIPAFRSSLQARVNYNEAVMIFLVLWSVWIAVKYNPEKLYTPRIYAVSSVLECTAYLGMAIFFSTSAYQSYLASFHSYALPYLLLTILVTMVISMIALVAMTLERSLLHYRQQAEEDPLTGLPNRRAFLERANKLHQDLPEEGSFTLVMFDLNELETVNDTFGHTMGDAVLRLFGSVCRDAATQQMVAGRLGGDQFGIYINGFDSEEAETFTNQLLRRFSASCHETTEGRLKQDVNAGIAVAQPVHSVERALEVAGLGVYRAKKNSNTRVIVLSLSSNGGVSAVENQGYGKLRTAPL